MAKVEAKGPPTFLTDLALLENRFQFQRHVRSVAPRQPFRAGDTSIHAVYDWWDRCLIDDMLSDEGNAFAQSYFDFERGGYLKDYARTLQRDLPSEFHVPFTEQNYQAIRAVIDQRYDDWRRASRP